MAAQSYTSQGKSQRQRRRAPITNVKLVGVCVRDSEKARDFYRDKLGFEVRADQPMGPGARWVEVGPRGAQTGLALFTPPGLESRIGTFSMVFFVCNDVRATYEVLRSRGVQFTREPEEHESGVSASFVDLDGNEFVLSTREPEQIRVARRMWG